MIKKNTSVENIKGIRISVETFYVNYYFFGKKKKYKFRNIITIYNQGKNTIQILSRHKKIFNLYGVKYLNKLIKNKPIIRPGKKIKLKTDFSTITRLSSVMGYFKIICLNTSTKCKAYIPTIKLTHPEILN